MAVATDSHRNFLIPDYINIADNEYILIFRCFVFILLCHYYNTGKRKFQAN